MTHTVKKDLSSQIFYPVIILVVCFFAFFANNHFIPADLMEARNLATAQEMVSQGNYLTPTLNGSLRLEKPPLPTWIAAAIEILSPDNLSAQRAASGIAATFMVFIFYLLLLELTDKKLFGLIGSLVLATSYNVIMMGRTATWDIYCHSFMLGAIYLIVTALRREGSQWTHFILAGILMGLSFLGKGPVSFYALLIPFLISYFISFKPSLKGKGFSIMVMIFICLIISLWWPVYIYLFHKNWGLQVADKESSSWIDHNVRPWYYYWKFPAEASIWALFWIISLGWFYWKKHFQTKKIYLFSILWTLISLVLLSAVPEKKTRYLLPMLIPGAINIASYLYYCITSIISEKERLIYKINVSVIILILIILPVGLYLMFFQKEYVSIQLYLIISALSFILAGFIYYYTFKTSDKYIYSFAGIVAVMVLVEGLCFIPVSKLFINDKRHSIKEVRDVSQLKDLPFYYIEGEELRMELIYESNRIIHPINIQNDSVIHSKLPFVLLSSTVPDSLLKGKQGIAIKQVGIYDNNWRKRDSKRYNPNLVRYVSILKNSASN